MNSSLDQMYHSLINNQVP